MKVLFLAPAISIHTKRWVKSLADKGVEIILVSQHPQENAAVIQGIQHVNLPFRGLKGYFLNVIPLRQIICKYKPDLVHAHYASGYGTTAALAGFKPMVISVWGSDVFDFPNASVFNSLLIIFNLKRANKILSTSHVMARETNKYSGKKIEVTPFGIDLNVFKPELTSSLFAPDDIVVGTVKTLEEKYGIEYLIRAFHIVKTKYPELPLKLLIVGGGSLEKHLKAIAEDLGLKGCFVFTGMVSHEDVPKYHNMLSVSVSVSISNSESFGVAIIEASACEKPVVVSNVGGLPEVVEDGVTGIVVPSKNISATAEAIERLVLNGELRQKMGRAGRTRVEHFYDWNNNVLQMIDIYKRTTSK